MSVFKLYMDSHIPKAVATQLRWRGVDVVRCQEVDKADDSDESHLEYAALERRTILTSNTKDFARLDTQWRQMGKFHAGIICVPEERKSDIGYIVEWLDFLKQAVEEGAATLDNDVYNMVRHI